MEIREVVIHSIDGAKHKIQFEQAATKFILGFKVETNGDELDKVKEQANNLLQYALQKSKLYKDLIPDGKAKVGERNDE